MRQFQMYGLRDVETTNIFLIPSYGSVTKATIQVASAISFRDAVEEDELVARFIAGCVLDNWKQPLNLVVDVTNWSIIRLNVLYLTVKVSHAFINVRDGEVEVYYSCSNEETKYRKIEMSDPDSFNHLEVVMIEAMNAVECFKVGRGSLV